MLWGAFNNASSAMMAMSWDMGSISQNIANVNTTGYKRKETLFQTVMSEGHAAPNGRMNAGPGLSIFGVQTADRTHITAQGVITPSGHWSDLAINGNGFFMVAPPNADGTIPTSLSTDNPNQVMYTRDGAFTFKTGSNGESYFMKGGQHLLGWMADDTGAVSATGMLQAVYTMPTTTMQGRATTTADVSANIPSSAVVTPSTYDSTISVTDPNGVARDLTLTWTRTGTSNAWTVTPSIGAFGTVTPATAVTMDGWGKISSPDPDGDPTTTPVPTDFTIDWDNVTYPAAPDTVKTVDLNNVKPGAILEKIPMQVFDSSYKEHSVTLGFERVGANTWNLHVDGGTGQTGTLAPIAVSFDSNGKLVSPTGTTSLALSWTTGGSTGTATVDIDLSKITQFDGDRRINFVNQDGYGQGTMLHSDFTEHGELKGYFTNGETRTLFKVPIAQFVSENNLDPVSGNLFRRTRGAGDITVSAVENAVGEPRLVAGSLENSTVDIEDEFTKMIVTQKAYSTNATVFKTADEMTMTVRDLKA